MTSSYIERMVPPCGGRWHCELCGGMTPPLVGSLIAGARHRCRTCDRTVCDSCSTVPLKGDRTCRTCYLQVDERKSMVLPREKYIFLLRHAQSTWNQNVDLVKTFRRCSLQGVSIKDVVSRAALLMAREVWHKDHPISEEGVRQTGRLRQKINAAQPSTEQLRPESSPMEGRQDESATGDAAGCDACQKSQIQQEEERIRRYYDNFLSRQQQIYCSPLLRALQTAHLVLPSEDGWGSIKLLKDARERYRFLFERDCIGTGVGAHIVDRAMQLDTELAGLQHRVDATDCAQKWWSDEPETEAEVEARLQTLWHRLLDEDGADSCVLVTHSNLIKALLMRFGGMDDEELMPDSIDSCHMGDCTASEASSPACCRTCPDEVEADADCEEDRFVDLASRHIDSEFDAESTSAWQVVSGGSDELRRLKVDRLQNCGVLGLRCALEVPQQELYQEVDGWVNIDSSVPVAAAQCALEPQWVAKDALLMFDSVLVR